MVAPHALWLLPAASPFTERILRNGAGSMLTRELSNGMIEQGFYFKRKKLLKTLSASGYGTQIGLMVFYPRLWPGTPKAQLPLLQPKSPELVKGKKSRKPELSFQVHDSLTFQYQRHLRGPILREIYKCTQSVIVPYPNPLQLTWTCSVSDKSWGECKSIDWPQDLAA